MENNVEKPSSWGEFVEKAVAVHAAKDADYDHRFMKALKDESLDGKTLWAWEVTKKLDRLRSWIKRGELQVKGEGVLDSVIDLSNYTLQYELSSNADPYVLLEPGYFKFCYNHLGPSYLLKYLTMYGKAGTGLLNLNDEVDLQVEALILSYWGVS